MSARPPAAVLAMLLVSCAAARTTTCPSIPAGTAARSTALATPSIPAEPSPREVRDRALALLDGADYDAAEAVLGPALALHPDDEMIEALQEEALFGIKMRRMAELNGLAAFPGVHLRPIGKPASGTIISTPPDKLVVQHRAATKAGVAAGPSLRSVSPFAGQLADPPEGMLPSLDGLPLAGAGAGVLVYSNGIHDTWVTYEQTHVTGRFDASSIMISPEIRSMGIILHEDRLFIQLSKRELGVVAAYDRSTGSLLWATDGGFGMGAGLVFFHGSVVITGTPRDKQASYVERFDAATGAVLERTWVGGGEALALRSSDDKVTMVGSLETLELALEPVVKQR